MEFFPAAFTGFLLTMSFPETSMAWLSWVALLPLFISIIPMDGKRAFHAGLVTGLCHFLSLIYWIVPTISTYGQLPLYLALPILFLLALYLALYPAFFCLGVKFLDAAPLLAPLTGALLWVSLEYLRAGLFTGFPWGLLGYSQYMNLTLIQIADVTGVYGISFLIVLTNGGAAVLFCMIKSLAFKKKKHENSGTSIGFAMKKKPSFKERSLDRQSCEWKPIVFWGICLAVLFQAVFFYGGKRLEEIALQGEASEKIRVAIIQGNIRQAMKWDAEHKLDTVKKYCDFSLDAALDGPELIIWPETALPFYYNWDMPLSNEVDACIRKAGTTFLIGSPAFTPCGKETYLFFNRAYMINRFGIVTGWYDKRHLVPFGEYVPLGKYLFFLGKIIAQAGDFSPGPRDVLPLKFRTSSAGILICFELIFPGLARDVVNNGAEILVTMTNDAWFGCTSAPLQHFSMAVFRAIENRRSVARAANTGISGFINPAGEIMDMTALYKETNLTVSLPCFKIETFYTRRGDLFCFFCMFAIMAVFVLKLLVLKCNVQSNAKCV